MVTMQVVTPPHNLEELLAVMAVRDEINMGTIDQVIMASPWAEKFRASNSGKVRVTAQAYADYFGVRCGIDEPHLYGL